MGKAMRAAKAGYVFYASTTPAKSTELRDEHSRAMYEWVTSENGRDGWEKVILIAGHTYKPVLSAGCGLSGLTEDLRRLKDALAKDPGNDGVELLKQIAETRTQIEFLKVFPQVDKPCYFNTGCCSYGDGDITGIEIAGGEIAGEMAG